MSRINTHNHTDGERIAAWIALVGRQTSTGVIAHFDLPRNYAMRCLRAAFLDGNLAKIRIGSTYFWVQVGDIPHLNAERLEREAAYKLARLQRLRLQGVVDHKGAMLEGDDWDVVQRIIPAMNAAPIMTRAVSSVFHLGAA